MHRNSSFKAVIQSHRCADTAFGGHGAKFYLWGEMHFFGDSFPPLQR